MHFSQIALFSTSVILPVALAYDGGYYYGTTNLQTREADDSYFEDLLLAREELLNDLLKARNEKQINPAWSANRQAKEIQKKESQKALNSSRSQQSKPQAP